MQKPSAVWWVSNNSGRSSRRCGGGSGLLATTGEVTPSLRRSSGGAESLKARRTTNRQIPMHRTSARAHLHTALRDAVLPTVTSKMRLTARYGMTEEDSPPTHLPSSQKGPTNNIQDLRTNTHRLPHEVFFTSEPKTRTSAPEEVGRGL